MKRRGLIRFQLLLLVALAAVVVIRVAKGPPPPDGLVVLVDLEPHHLRHEVFELLAETDVVVQATGSLDEEAMPAGFAAQGWILRHDDREVVWAMNPRQVERASGSLARVPGDTLTLDAGLYEAFFAAYGQAETSRRRSRWRKDASQWQFVVKLLDEAAPARVLYGQRLEPVETSPDQLLWAARAMRNEAKQGHLFEVKAPTHLEIHAVGEIDDKQRDFAWIENLATGERVWALTRDNTEPAGGLASNRRFRGPLAVQPGLYQVVAETNSRHAFHRWQGNPPYDPAAWGIALYAEDTDAVATFDPWEAQTPVISFAEVENGADLDAPFEVTEPASVLIYGLGEMTGPGKVYDFATLFKENRDGSQQALWSMTWETSVEAGGDQKNRREVKMLPLEPGRYTFHYETDQSHAFEHWNAQKPDQPERWGATLFAETDLVERGVIRQAAPVEPEPEPTPEHVGEPLVDWTRLTGTVEQQSEVFELSDETTLHIVALGEITDKGQHDYGWIERVDDETLAWEMTLDNTRSAGGDTRNRRFDDVVTLPPGHYIVHYITDASHHYASFTADAPSDPEAWGITIYYVAEEGAGTPGK